MEYFVYKCKNERCSGKFKEKRGSEKICPICGTETVLYKIRGEKYIPSWFLYLFAIVAMLLVVCIAGYIYLQFFSEEPIFPISVSEEAMIRVIDGRMGLSN